MTTGAILTLLAGCVAGLGLMLCRENRLRLQLHALCLRLLTALGHHRGDRRGERP